MDVLDGVISELRSVCASLPDKRTGSNIRYEIADFGLSAFSLYLHAEPVVSGPSACTFARAAAFELHAYGSGTPAESALSRARERSNCETLFAMSRIPTDNQIRAMLDPVTPDRLYPLFVSLLERLEAGGGCVPSGAWTATFWSRSTAPNTSARGRSPAPTARGASAAMEPWSITTTW